MNIISLLKRKKGSLCIWISLCVVSLYIISFQEHQIGKRNEEFYTVSIHHYGVDAREIERSITIPLEDALFSIPGILSIQSFSENNLSRVYIRFKKNRRFQYELVREAVQRVYEVLPSSVQRPEIHNSDNSVIPVWTAAFFDINDNNTNLALFLEKIIKPKLESIDGIGEVYISGTGITEIMIAVDQQKMTSLNLQTVSVAQTLAMNDSLFPCGTINHNGKEIVLTVDGRYGYENISHNSLVSELGEAVITIETGKPVKLSDIAVIYEQERMPDTISRLNGRNALIVSIMCNSKADLRKLSGEIGHKLDENISPYTFTVLSDKGAQEASSFKSICFAALQASCMVALICYILNRKKLNRRKFAGLFSALSVPAICLISISILSIFGFPLNRFVLAGIAGGMGAAVGPVILCCTYLQRCNSYSKAGNILKELCKPLIAGALTTIAALIPILSIDTGIEIIVWAIGVITLAALILSLTVLPPLLLWEKENIKKKDNVAYSRILPILSQILIFLIIMPHRKIVIIREGFETKVLEIKYYIKKYFQIVSQKILRKLYRMLAINVKNCVRYPKLICCIGLLVSSIGIVVIFLHGTDPVVDISEDSVYGHIEFESGLLTEEVDSILAEYGKTISKKTGILNVQTGARTGSGYIFITFNPKLTTVDTIQQIARSVPVFGGFVFFPETSGTTRHWEIKISGDDDVLLMDLAEELANKFGSVSFINEIVLNFKRGSKKLYILPDYEKISYSNINFSHIANSTRMSIYGPVIYKRKDINREIDVRIRNDGLLPSNSDTVYKFPYKNEISKILINTNLTIQKPAILETLVRMKESIESSSIKRENRRRTASITIITKPLSMKFVKYNIEKITSKFDLPQGYTIKFDPEVIRKNQLITNTYIMFIFVIIFCYIILAAINESLILPVIVLSVILPSVSVPALYISILNYSFNIQCICAFMVVSGIAINAAVLCISGLKQIQSNKLKSLNLYLIIRNKIPSLLSTTMATFSGSLPFLLLKEAANSFITLLSLITSIGVIVSFVSSITIVPCLYIIIYSRDKKYKLF